MDCGQLRHLITNILKGTVLYSEDAIELLLLTAAVESSMGHFLRQLGGGPALGIFQMEPSTLDDIWKNYLYRKQEFRLLIEKYTVRGIGKEQLEWNLAYQIIMARIHYYRVPKELPSRYNVADMASFWKIHYNSSKGRGVAQDAVDAYMRYC